MQGAVKTTLSIRQASLAVGVLLVLTAGPSRASSVQSVDQSGKNGSSSVRSMEDWHKQKHTDRRVWEATVRQDDNRRDPGPAVEGNGKSSRSDLPEQPDEKESEKAQKPYQLTDPGYCLPSGRYHWETKAGPRDGVVPNPTYPQSLGITPGHLEDSGYRGMIDQLENLIPDEAKGTPITNAEFATLAAAQAEAVSERINDAQELMMQNRAAQAAKQADAANNAAECAEGNCDTAMAQMLQYLLNVANEEAATPTTAQAPFKTYSQAVWMIQQMYKHCYIPMAILFLLPGAVITQAKSMVGMSVVNSRDEDTQTPFSGIMRATIAIFLIPATQLIVSYVIDVGNSVTYCVATEIEKHGGLEAIEKWSHEQTYNTDARQNQNFVPKLDPTASNPTVGKISGKSEQMARFENMTNLSTTMQQWFNTFNNILAQGLNILNGFQLIMMCYLFLLGPVAASFFAWPSGVGRDLFKKVFSNWLDGVVILALWKFWWCVCLLCMVLRLSTGAVQNPTDQYELFMYTAFMGILMFVPFNPFEFRPGEVVSHVLEKAQQQAGKAGQTGSGGGGGGGPAGGGGSGNGGGGPGGSGGPVGARGE